jgi:hypothetical protein
MHSCNHATMQTMHSLAHDCTGSHAVRIDHRRIVRIDHRRIGRIDHRRIGRIDHGGIGRIDHRGAGRGRENGGYDLSVHLQKCNDNLLPLPPKMEHTFNYLQIQLLIIYFLNLYALLPL